jgi:hypothetical protein
MDAPDRLPLSDAAPLPTSPVSKQLASHEMIERTNLLMQQLGWTIEEGRAYLKKTYGQRSRHLLTDEELL